MIANCLHCGGRFYHAHWHDEAHGVAGTHMTGSERFVCGGCNHMTFACEEPKNPAFKFLFDK